jgi:two-component system, sensor histidine kinase
VTIKSANLLLFMINDILDFSQIKNGKLRLNLTDFRAYDVVKEVSKLIKFQAKRKGLEFILKKSNNYHKDIIINSDPNRVKQILLNLLGNALKFTTKGQIIISIEVLEEVVKSEKNLITITQEEKPRKIKISIQDTGCGIKKEDIPRLFNLFGRLENPESIKINPNGIGLGLAISQNLVERLNPNQEHNKIYVRSHYGEGSCFWFFLNEKIISDTDELLSERLTQLSEYQTKFFGMKPFNSTENNKKNVLVVDDDQINLTVISTYLEKIKGFSFKTAFNGQEAVKMVKEATRSNKPFDFIVMDCNMPVMNGFDATRKILKMINKGKVPPLKIIAATADTSKAEHDLCLKVGMKSVLVKPFTMNDLSKILEDNCIN